MRWRETALDELAADAPLERLSWADVTRRHRERFEPHERRRRGLRRRGVLATAGLVALAAGGTAIADRLDLVGQQERFHATPRFVTDARSPFVEIASGEEWALVAWRSGHGVCLDFAVPGNASFSCDFPVRGAQPEAPRLGRAPPTLAVAGFVSGANLVGGDGKTTIFGVAAEEAAAVRIELHDGAVVEAELHDAPAELGADVRIFLARLLLPARGHTVVRSYSAYDEQGALLGRQAG